jgi:predicted RNA binding protein YcfA (HicA-like mRNA interferase family)
MPRKIRDLIVDLEGSHRNFTHPRVARPITISGRASDDAKKYQEKAVQAAIAEATQ